ncbi:MAG: D-alanyl-D-alanine carboxypeptidase family protein [Leptolyngbyaceae cyanobacterium]
MAPNSFSPIDDIPEAQRDDPLQPQQSIRFRGMTRWIIWFLVGLVSAIAGLVVSWWTYQGVDSPVPIALRPMVSSSPSGGVPQTEDVSTNEPPSIKTILGHRAYEEAPESELVSLAYNGSIQLQPAAAEKFETMMAAAKAQGIYLSPISGFRSIEDQNYLFFEVKEDRVQGAATRAEVSAPPGYSEHHTGYAIDIGDANYPDTDLQIRFEETPAFQWLEQNAPAYSFELSFPEGNAQNIQYEPWHWRFVGDSDSLETFYQDR